MARQRSTESGLDRGMRSGSATMQEDQEQGGGVIEQTKGKAQQLASQAQEQASARVESGLTRGKTRAAETLGGVAQSLLASSQQLRDRNQPGTGQYVERAADQVQRLSDYLQNTDVSGIVDRVEDIARRQPALFLGGAFAVGLLGARFLKSSRRREGQVVSSEYRSMRAPTRRTYERDVTGFYGVATEAPLGERTTPGPRAAPLTEPMPPSELGFESPAGQTGIGAPPPNPEGFERR